MIIGLAGYARSGKDAAAKIMVEEFGFTRVAFADPLRSVLYALNPYVTGMDGEIRLQDIIDTYGWNGYKENGPAPYVTEIRELLQRMGTEAGRDILGQNIWVDTAFKNMPEGDVVITDTRFSNEANGIKQRGGEVWRIRREGVGPANDHPSETAIDGWSGYTRFIHNNNDLEAYENDIRRILAQYRLS